MFQPDVRKSSIQIAQVFDLCAQAHGCPQDVSGQLGDIPMGGTARFSIERTYRCQQGLSSDSSPTLTTCVISLDCSFLDLNGDANTYFKALCGAYRCKAPM